MTSKNLILALISVVFLLLSCNSNKENNENKKSLNVVKSEIPKYYSKDGHFKINFPGEPKIESSSIPTELGNIEMVSFLYEKSATEVYMLAYSDYPSEYITASDNKSLLNSTITSFLDEIGGLVIEKQTDIMLDSNYGIFIKAKNDSYFVVLKDFIVGNRLYQIVILRDGTYPSDEAVANYFDSFELVKE